MNWPRIAISLACLALGLGLAQADPGTDGGPPSETPDLVSPTKTVRKEAAKLIKKAAGLEADSKSADKGDDTPASTPRPFVAKPAAELPSLGEDEGRGQRVVVIPINGTIDLGLAPFIDRALEQARGAALVIFDVDTFGGRVDAAVKIRDAILASDLPTLAYVNRRAISAGALISLAADYIVFAPGGSLGAATPVQMQGGQAQAVGEKMVSYMRSEMRATAEAKGRNGDLAEAMVDADVAVEGVTKQGKLLTVTTKLAVELGLANAKIDNVDAILDAVKLPRAQISRPETNWAEGVARFLTDPVVSGLLMSLGMLGLLLEFYSPGFGVTGGLGLMCLMLFFGGHMVVDLAGWEEMALFMLGLVAVAVEVFIIPGFGIAGVIGIALIAASLIMSMVGLPLSTSWEVGDLGLATTTVVIALFVTGIASIIIIRYLPGSSIGQWLVLETTLGGSSTGALPAVDEPSTPGTMDNRDHLDAEGVALTDLRPSGKMQVGDNVLDVVSRDQWIERGTPIKVVSVEGIRIVVIEVG